MDVGTNVMRAVWYESNGPAGEVLVTGEMARPEPKAGDVLVRLHASGVNPSDVKARAGARPMAFDRVIPHSDGAGVVEAVDEVGGTLLVTADHGNIELMMDQQTGEPQTSHTIGDVPFILYPAQQGRMLNQGSLCDIAPTILGLMGIKQPSAMTGKSLLN